MGRAHLAPLWAAALALLLLVGPAFAQPVGSIPVPKPPRERPITEEPIYILAHGNAVLQFKNVSVPASLYLAGRVQRRPWLPIAPMKHGQPGWIKIEVLTVKVGDRQFNFSGYGILASGRIVLVGRNVDAAVFVHGTIASNSSVNLQGTLLVRPWIKPLPPGNFWKPEVWRLKLQGFISGEPPVVPLK